MQTNPQQSEAARYVAALVEGRKFDAMEQVIALHGEGWSVQRIYREVLELAQVELGELWQANAISVAQEHYGSAVTQLVMCRLYDLGLRGARRRNLRALVCAPGDELHAIGLRMVADFLDIAGWDTYEIGGNTPVEEIPAAAAAHGVGIVALSATMPESLGAVRRAVKGLRADAACSEMPIIVGGRAFANGSSTWRELDVDGYAPDATRAVELAESLLVGSASAS